MTHESPASAPHHHPIKDVDPKESTILGFGFALDLGYTIAIPAVGFGLGGGYLDKQMNFQQITSRLNESEWEITVKNAKDTPVTVFVDEWFGNNWKILSSSLPYKKLGAFNVRFEVPVAANSSTTLKYKVQNGF